jgi:hypothetical protein
VRHKINDLGLAASAELENLQDRGFASLLCGASSDPNWTFG